MKSKGLNFLPLYWMYHNEWKFMTWAEYIHDGASAYRFDFNLHRGHMHFFMMGFDYDTQQAYSGTQKYSFSIDDWWSNRSKDPNQQMNGRVVGSPKWYFHVTEYWRRVYIQWWDKPNNSIINKDTIVGRQGVKYDACYAMHLKGPYREGRDNYFFMTNPTRTLPVEYWKDDERIVRDHYLRDENGGDGHHIWNTKNIAEDAERMIPDENPVGEPYVHYGDNDRVFNKERNYGRADFEYMFPTLEYQKVVQLDWERPPGWEDRDIDENTFGDGFEIEITLPFRDDNNVIQSPFSEEGVVKPPGTYCNGFDTKFPELVMRYPTVDKGGVPNYPDDGGENQVFCKSYTYNIPDELKGQPVVWHVPEHLQGYEDGMWVEQCLGGIVHAKALVTIEDNFGGRHDVWVTSQQFMSVENFEGIDQNAPV